MDTLPLLVGTADGLLVCERDGSRWSRTLVGYHVTAVIAREGVILAGTLQKGVFYSEDLGGEWVACSNGLPNLEVRWLAFHPDVSDLELVGLANGEVFVSRDGATSWRPVADDADLAWRGALLAGRQVTAVTTMYP